MINNYLIIKNRPKIESNELKINSFVFQLTKYHDTLQLQVFQQNYGQRLYFLQQSV